MASGCALVLRVPHGGGDLEVFSFLRRRNQRGVFHVCVGERSRVLPFWDRIDSIAEVRRPCGDTEPADGRLSDPLLTLRSHRHRKGTRS
jgi:hypothetical protein